MQLCGLLVCESPTLWQNTKDISANMSNIFQTKSAENLEKKRFNFDCFLNNMKSSAFAEVSDSDIDLGYYLIAYDQLYSFFLLLGGAFQFVASDVKSKIEILNRYRDEELKNKKSISNFKTVKTMVGYEKKNNLLFHTTYVSGCRTLLRLHRGLDFFKKFLKELHDAENNLKLCGVARKVYDQTLAEFHTFVVRNSARVAMQFLPTRLELLNKISYNDTEQIFHILESIPDALEIMDVVYDRIQDVYIENEMLQLP